MIFRTSRPPNSGGFLFNKKTRKTKNEKNINTMSGGRMRGGGYVDPAGTCRRWQSVSVKSNVYIKLEKWLLLPNG